MKGFKIECQIPKFLSYESRKKKSQNFASMGSCIRIPHELPPLKVRNNKVEIKRRGKSNGLGNTWSGAHPEDVGDVPGKSRKDRANSCLTFHVEDRAGAPHHAGGLLPQGVIQGRGSSLLQRYLLNIGRKKRPLSYTVIQ